MRTHAHTPRSDVHTQVMHTHTHPGQMCMLRSCTHMHTHPVHAHIQVMHTHTGQMCTLSSCTHMHTHPGHAHTPRSDAGTRLQEKGSTASSIHTVEYVSASRRHRHIMDGPGGLLVTGLSLSKTSQSQKDKHCGIPLTPGYPEPSISKGRRQGAGCQAGRCARGDGERVCRVQNCSSARRQGSGMTPGDGLSLAERGTKFCVVGLLPPLTLKKIFF